MQPWKFFLRKVPGLPGSGMPPKLSFDEHKTAAEDRLLSINHNLSQILYKNVHSLKNSMLNNYWCTGSLMVCAQVLRTAGDLCGMTHPLPC